MFFLAFCSAGDHKAREYKGKRFLNPQSGDGNKLAFLPNNKKISECLKTPSGFGRLENDSPGYVL